MTTRELFYTIALALAVCLLTSCSGHSYVAFWSEFKADLITETKEDQGGHGGHLAQHWKSNVPNTFLPKDVLALAKENGWELSDSSRIDTSISKKWVDWRTPIFPLSHMGIDTNVSSMVWTYDYFPRCIVTNFSVYAFKTGIYGFDPATDEELSVNGFVVISEDGSEMSVYHLWGSI